MSCEWTEELKTIALASRDHVVQRGPGQALHPVQAMPAPQAAAGAEGGWGRMGQMAAPPQAPVPHRPPQHVMVARHGFGEGYRDEEDRDDDEDEEGYEDDDEEVPEWAAGGGGGGAQPELTVAGAVGSFQRTMLQMGVGAVDAETAAKALEVRLVPLGSAASFRCPFIPQCVATQATEAEAKNRGPAEWFEQAMIWLACQNEEAQEASRQTGPRETMAQVKHLLLVFPRLADGSVRGRRQGVAGRGRAAAARSTAGERGRLHADPSACPGDGCCFLCRPPLRSSPYIPGLGKGRRRDPDGLRGEPHIPGPAGRRPTPGAAAGRRHAGRSGRAPRP